MKIPGNVVDQLVQGAQSDIRQVINMLSTWRLSNETMDFDQGKALYAIAVFLIFYFECTDVGFVMGFQGEDERKVHVDDAVGHHE